MIGILDWGIGGLGFWKELRRRHPRVPVVYWSDAGEIPYGKLPAARLARRVREVTGRLADRGVRQLVVACHAASTVLPALGISRASGVIETPGGAVEVTGVISHAVTLALASGARTIGVIGGRRTIRSGIYRRALAGGRRRIHQRVAQPLSARVEAGDLASRGLDEELTRILRPLRDVEALLLACTHYPALAPRLALQLPRARLLDPVDELVSWVAEHWVPAQPTESTPTALRDLFLTTGDSGAMRRAAAAAFGVRLGRVRALRCLAVKTTCIYT